MDGTGIGGIGIHGIPGGKGSGPGLGLDGLGLGSLTDLSGSDVGGESGSLNLFDNKSFITNGDLFVHPRPLNLSSCTSCSGTRLVNQVANQTLGFPNSQINSGFRSS